MTTVSRALVTSALAIAGQAASAGPTAEFQVEFLLTSVKTIGNQVCSDGVSTPVKPYFGCTSVGDVFTGTFGVDSDILVGSGVVKESPIINFRLPFGDVVFSNTVVGQYDGDAYKVFFNNFGSFGKPNPAYVLVNGKLQDFDGSMYFGSDITFIDFFGGNAFQARDGVNVIDGRMLITAVPEPSTYAMFAAGVVALLAVRRRRLN